MVSQIETGDRITGEELRSLLKQLPVLPENAENCIHLLMLEGGQSVLCSKNIPYDFSRHTAIWGAPFAGAWMTFWASYQMEMKFS